MISKGRTRIDHISKDVVLGELRRIGLIFENQYFGKRDFDQHSTLCKSTKVIDTFGSWEKALLEIGISEKGVRSTRKDKIDDQDLIKEMVRIWKLLGHRPSKAEWESLETRFGYTTIKQRFLGWTNACNEALRVLNLNFEEGCGIENVEGATLPSNPKVTRRISTEEKRNIPLKLRLKILRRDMYKCVFCGRNPSTDSSVELHIDHILPFSLGGKTEEDNLRTLCRECNIGRGNDESF
jgi:hypothetical protein